MFISHLGKIFKQFHFHFIWIIQTPWFTWRNGS